MAGDVLPVVAASEGVVRQPPGFLDPQVQIGNGVTKLHDHVGTAAALQANGDADVACLLVTVGIRMVRPPRSDTVQANRLLCV